MKIRNHCHSLKVLSDLMSTTKEDCSAWLEEFITDISVELDRNRESNQLGDNITDAQLSELTGAVIGHYDKENNTEVPVPCVKQLIYFLIIS